MESRMRGNSHVRFGAGDEETCPGDGARRFIPTLPESPPDSHSSGVSAIASPAMLNTSAPAAR